MSWPESPTAFRRAVEAGKTPYGYRLLVGVDLCPTSTRVLDLGCGDGALTYLLEAKGHTVVGVDRVTTGIDFNAPQLPFADQEFPVVICLDVLEHVLDPRHLLRETARILRPHGVLILVTPNIRYLPHLWTLACGQFPCTSGDPTGYDGGHLHYFTYRDVRELMRHAGFRHVEEFNFADWNARLTQWHGWGRGFLTHRLTTLLGRRLQREFFSSSVVMRATK
jgi:SAM-dependent methyltransferase